MCKEDKLSDNRHKLMAEKLNSMNFCHFGELSISEIHALNIFTKIRLSDFNEKTLSELTKGEVSTILITECNCYGYVPNSPYWPLKNEEIDEFISDDDNLGSLGGCPIMTFGREIRVEDIPMIGIGHFDFKLYQDVSEMMVKVIDTWTNDQHWQESIRKECIELGLDDPCLNYSYGSWGWSMDGLLGQTKFIDDILDDCAMGIHIAQGGVWEGIILGHSIGSKEFGITNEYYMDEDEHLNGIIFFYRN